ncbi:MAG: aminopeptidase [Clostridiales bacterium]|nr:aminopeptidase [Clostridiales bacterium]
MDKKLDKYAELIIKQGVNLQRGEPVAITAPILAADLVREVVNQAYRAGAPRVTVFWSDPQTSRLHYDYQTEEELKNIPQWVVDSRNYIVDTKAVYINIISEQPDLLKNIPPQKVVAAGRASSKALERFRESTGSNQTRWLIVAYPNVEWAKKMFPELSDKAALEKQWKYIHKTMRLDKADSLGAWQKHAAKLAKRSRFLNRAKIVSLHYKNSLGTDFTIGMPKGYIFTGAVEKGGGGVEFTANMPTEEVFSSPHRLTANGTLVASKPLVRAGGIMENFSLTFKDGRIVDYKAEKGYDTLKGIIETDEGSHYLGEIALVGYNSPIQNLNTLFYNTLFDENASCHFAIGRAFPGCIKGGDKLTREQQVELGLNDSLEHVDFMVGTPDLSIVATTEKGEEIVIFKDGDWAI